MTPPPLSLGFSPCPNDTFIFHALSHGLVPRAPGFAPPRLEDVETLNLWALEQRLDVSKISFHALGHVDEHYQLLDSGAALGRGCGPLLVARRSFTPKDLPHLRIAIPGRFTTAAMLLGLYATHTLGDSGRLLFAPGVESDHQENGGALLPKGGITRSGPGLYLARFDQIMPALTDNDFDAGVIIHESRFTYREHGLTALVDLGAWWEEISGLPIPLGGIVARRSLGEGRLADISEAIKRSLIMARENPAAAMEYIQNHAGELEPKVIRSHIELYVNDFSLELGDEGRRAVEEFLKRGREAGVIHY